MDRRLARRLALLLVGVVVALVVVTLRAPRSPATPTASGPFDAPLGEISCDEVPVKPPDPDEIAEDERTRPYHLKVRTLSFPDLQPIDVEMGRLVVRGATDGKRLAAGEYLFENLPFAI